MAEIKLMQLSLQNRIVDNSDFKPFEFDHRFWSDSDTSNEIVSLIAILISFPLKLITFDVFLIKRSIEGN